MKIGDLICIVVFNIVCGKLCIMLIVFVFVVGVFILMLIIVFGVGIFDYVMKQVVLFGVNDVLFVFKVLIILMVSSGLMKYNLDIFMVLNGMVNLFMGFSGLFIDVDISILKGISGFSEVLLIQMVLIDWVFMVFSDKYEFLIVLIFLIVKFDFVVGVQFDVSSFEKQFILLFDYVKVFGFGSVKVVVGILVMIGIIDIFGVKYEVEVMVVGILNISLLSLGVGVNVVFVKELVVEQKVGMVFFDCYQVVVVYFDVLLLLVQVDVFKKKISDVGMLGQMIVDQFGIIQMIIMGIIGVFNVFVIVVLLVVVFGIVNMLLMSVQECICEIGLMKVMGMGSG